MKTILTSLFITLFALSTLAQDVPNIPAGSKLAMYVEYGGKGVKFGVIAYTDKNYRKYTPIENQELNVGLSKAIQATGSISKQDIDAITSSSYDKYQQLLHKYESKGLTDNNVYFYTSSGVGVAKNVQDLCNSLKEKTGHGVYVVKETEEAKYTIAGTIPYEKIDVALVLDQGGSNTKGGYIIKEGNSLTGMPTNFDLGSVRVEDLIKTNYMISHSENKDTIRQDFITGMNRCFDSLRKEINRTFSNIQGAESRDELYLSGGAAFAITTLLYPEAPLKDQMVEVNYDKLNTFFVNIQNRDYYVNLKDKTLADEKQMKNYKGALNIYTQLQLISATKLLLTYINALGGDEKKIYFNRYGLHSMPSMLIGRVLRGDAQRW